MKVGIITCLTCMLPVTLTVGGPIRRQACQSEKTAPIGGNVTLRCVVNAPDVIWQYVYWKKNDQTFYTLDVNSSTPSPYDTRYEVSNHASRLTIKDLKETDNGTYHCKVATYATTNFTEEGCQVLLSVTDQAGGLFTTSPGVPFRASTKIPPKPIEVKTIILSTILSILLLIITLYLVFKYRKRITDFRFVRYCRRLLPQGSPTIISDQANIPPRAQDSTTFSSLDATPPRDQISSSTPLIGSSTKLQQGSQPNITDQADISPTGQESTISSRFDASALFDPNSCSTPQPHSSAQLQQGSPANISDQANISSRAQDSTTSSRFDASAPYDPNSCSTPQPQSSAQASSSTSTPLAPDVSCLKTRDETSHLPLVGPVLIDDLRRASTRLVVDSMSKLLHSLINLHEGQLAPPNDGKYSFLKKYVWCIPEGVLADVEYFLDELDHIPVGRKRDVCEILLTMSENMDKSKIYSNKSIFKEYDQDDQGNAIKHYNKSRSKKLEGKMRSILQESETRDDARNYISLIILGAPVEKSESASFSQEISSTFNQSANKTDQTLSFPSQTGDLRREDDNLIEFWLSKVIKLQPKVQRRVIDQFGDFEQDADCSSLEKPMGRQNVQNPDAKNLAMINGNESTNWGKAMDPPKMQNVDAKAVKMSNLKETTDREAQPSKSLRPLETNSQVLSVVKLLYDTVTAKVPAEASRLKDEKEGEKKEIYSKDEEKAMGDPDMQNNDAKEVKKNTKLNESTDRNKKSIGIPEVKEIV